MAEDWKQHQISADNALENLTLDQASTVAKMLALQIGSYRKIHGDYPVDFD